MHSKSPNYAYISTLCRILTTLVSLLENFTNKKQFRPKTVKKIYDTQPETVLLRFPNICHNLKSLRAIPTEI